MMVIGWYVVDLISFGCWYFGLFHRNSRNMFGCSHRIILRQLENRHGFKSIACLCSFFGEVFLSFYSRKGRFRDPKTASANWGSSKNRWNMVRSSKRVFWKAPPHPSWSSWSSHGNIPTWIRVCMPISLYQLRNWRMMYLIGSFF